MIERCHFKGCIKESEYGAHGIRENAVYSEYWCSDHYRSRETSEKTENALELVRKIARGNTDAQGRFGFAKT